MTKITPDGIVRVEGAKPVGAVDWRLALADFAIGGGALGAKLASLLPRLDINKVLADTVVIAAGVDDEWAPFFFFLAFFPTVMLEVIASHTQARIRALAGNGNANRVVTVQDILKVIGIFVSISSAGSPCVSECWRTTPEGREARAAGATNLPDFEDIMPYSKFRLLSSSLAFGPGSRDNRWAFIDPFVDAFNARMKSVYRPGRTICADESMIGWTGRGSWDWEAIPFLVKIQRKPTPVGLELKNLACALARVIIALEVQKGKEAMAGAAYRAETGGALTAVLLRLTELQNLHRKGYTVCADAAFASVNTAMHLARYGISFVGCVKTCTAGFPIAHLKKVGAELTRGQSRAFETVHKGVPMWSLVWVDKSVKYFIGTTGSVEPAAVQVRRRWLLNHTKGTRTPVDLHIPVPNAVKYYFDAANAIDICNQHRQIIGLEDVWGTRTWFIRIFTGILGMIVSNAYNYYVFASGTRRTLSRSNFVRVLAEELMRNTHGEHRTRTEASAARAARAAKTTAAPEAHKLEKLSTLPAFANHKRARLQCRECNKKGGAIMFCVRCTAVTGSVYPLCATSGVSNCHHDHIVRAVEASRKEKED